MKEKSTTEIEIERPRVEWDDVQPKEKGIYFRRWIPNPVP